MMNPSFKVNPHIADIHHMEPDIPIHLTPPSAPKLPLLLVLVLAISFWGCTSTPASRQIPMPAAKQASPPQPATQNHASAVTVEQRIRQQVRLWEGTPHRMGGTRRSGVDCSGFVQRIFNDLFHIKIPRSTELQVHAGEAVPFDQLRPGDLVFFKPPHKVRHVGIYLGSGEFAHASTSKGVTISRIDMAYWRDAYWTSRRVPNISG